jgi:hypothetical protein
MWTDKEWSQRRLDKAALEAELNELDMTVHGWCNRKPDVVRDDGEPVDWDEVEKIAWRLFLTPPKQSNAVKEEKPEIKDEPKPKPKKRRSRSKKK